MRGVDITGEACDRTLGCKMGGHSEGGHRWMPVIARACTLWMAAANFTCNDCDGERHPQEIGEFQ
jgi:hypothetical protein